MLWRTCFSALLPYQGPTQLTRKEPYLGISCTDLLLKGHDGIQAHVSALAHSAVLALRNGRSPVQVGDSRKHILAHMQPCKGVAASTLRSSVRH